MKKHELFLEVFVDFGIITDELRIRPEDGDLQNISMSNDYWQQQDLTVGSCSTSTKLPIAPSPIAILVRFTGGFSTPK